MNIFQTIKAIIVGIISLPVIISGVFHPQVNANQPQSPTQTQNFGAGVVQAQKFQLAGSGVAATVTSITLQSFKLPDASTTIAITDFQGSVGYGTLEPGTSREEQISFSGVSQNGNGTATLTGVTRGLDFRGSNCTAVSSNQKAHAGGAIFILSNTACYYGNFPTKSGTEYITGVWTFASGSIPRASSTPSYPAGSELQFATKAYVDNVATSGAANASLTQKGIIQIPTKTELAIGSSTGSTGAFLGIPASYANATSSATSTVVVTGNDGKISSSFIATSSPYTWTATTTHSGPTIFTGSTTFTGIVTGITTSKLLQSTSTVLTTATSTQNSTTSWIGVQGLSLTLTPSATTSLMRVSGVLNWSNNTDTAGMFGRLVRNGVPIAVGTAVSGRTGATFAFTPRVGSSPTIDIWTQPFDFTDTPATTTPLTYQVQVLNGVGGPTMFINQSAQDGAASSSPRTISSINLQEITP